MSNVNLTRALVPGSFGIHGREMDELFDHLFHPTSNGHSGKWMPPASIWEEGEYLNLEIELAGVAQDDIDLSFEAGLLKVTAKRPKPENEEREYLHNERTWGEVTRSMKIPDSVDPESIDATLSNGVLQIQLAKRAEVLPKKIEIKKS